MLRKTLTLPRCRFRASLVFTAGFWVEGYEASGQLAKISLKSLVWNMGISREPI